MVSSSRRAEVISEVNVCGVVLTLFVVLGNWCCLLDALTLRTGVSCFDCYFVGCCVAVGLLMFPWVVVGSGFLAWFVGVIAGCGGLYRNKCPRTSVWPCVGRAMARDG